MSLTGVAVRKQLQSNVAFTQRIIPFCKKRERLSRDKTVKIKISTSELVMLLDKLSLMSGTFIFRKCFAKIFLSGNLFDRMLMEKKKKKVKNKYEVQI